MKVGCICSTKVSLTVSEHFKNVFRVRSKAPDHVLRNHALYALATKKGLDNVSPSLWIADTNTQETSMNIVTFLFTSL